MAFVVRTVLILCLFSQAKATIIHVPGDATTIQGGIDGAVDGDTVLVAKGIYYENVDVNKAVHLIGEGRDSTIIDGGGIDRVVAVSAGLVSITGFTIRNCGVYDAGIYLAPTSSHNAISDNIVTSNTGYGGIHSEGSDSNTIWSNIVSYNKRGIYLLTRSCSNILVGNQFANNTVCGIRLEGTSTDNVISGNEFTNNGGRGIFADGYCDRNQIVENLFDGNLAGVYLCHSFSNIVSRNTMNNNCWGAWLDTWAAQNMVVENILDGNEEGIAVTDASNNTVSHNTVMNSLYSGIDVQGKANTVSGNIIADVENGIWVEGYNHTIEGNDISNARQGIYLFWNCHNDSIIANNIESCGRGILVEYSHYDNLFAHNTIAGNGTGMDFWGGFNNTITENTISNSSCCGIRLTDDCYGNVFYHNNFIDNDTSAWDEGNNTWDNGYPSGGNYWSDYTGSDDNHGPGQNQAGADGIGDTPHDVPVGVQDAYPFVNPFVCGDVRHDGSIDVADAVFLVNYVLKDGAPPIPESAGDVNRDAMVDIQDVYYLLVYLFQGGPPPCGP